MQDRILVLPERVELVCGFFICSQIVGCLVSLKQRTEAIGKKMSKNFFNLDYGERIVYEPRGYWGIGFFFSSIVIELVLVFGSIFMLIEVHRGIPDIELNTTVGIIIGLLLPLLPVILLFAIRFFPFKLKSSDAKIIITNQRILINNKYIGTTVLHFSDVAKVYRAIDDDHRTSYTYIKSHDGSTWWFRYFDADDFLDALKTVAPSEAIRIREASQKLNTSEKGHMTSDECGRKIEEIKARHNSFDDSIRILNVHAKINEQIKTFAKELKKNNPSITNEDVRKAVDEKRKKLERENW